jgi:hypothetical protein
MPWLLLLESGTEIHPKIKRPKGKSDQWMGGEGEAAVSSIFSS